MPLRQGPQRFVGPVVFICDLADGFEIGVELSLADAERAAIVERICELEARLQRDAVAAARHRAAEWATLRPRLERIPSLKALVSAALPGRPDPSLVHGAGSRRAAVATRAS